MKNLNVLNILKKTTCLLIAAQIIVAATGCGKVEDSTNSAGNSDNSLVEQDNNESETLKSFEVYYDDGTTYYELTAGINVDGDSEIYFRTADEVKYSDLQSNQLKDIQSFVNELGLVEFDSLSVSPELYGTAPYIEFTVEYTDRTVHGISCGEIDERLKEIAAKCFEHFTEFTKNFENIGQDSTEDDLLPVDPVAKQYMNRILENATTKGWKVELATTSNGFNYEGMAKFYTGIDPADPIMDYVTSITANMCQLQTTAYQLVFIGTNDLSQLDNIAEMVKNNIDWTKFVCVRPTNAAVTTYRMPDTDQLDQNATKGFIIFILGEKTDSLDNFTPVYEAVQEFAGGGFEILENPEIVLENELTEQGQLETLEPVAIG